MKKLKNILQWLRKRRSLLIVITAALLLELLSGAQYYFTHEILEDELEKRAEGELRLKAVLIKSTLNSAEDIITNHLYDIKKNLSQPDSLYGVLSQMVLFSRQITGGAVCFVPDYYPEKGRLFEPYVKRTNDEAQPLSWRQIASEKHDYTKSEFYQKAIAYKSPTWVDPYMDNEGAENLVTSYAQPVFSPSNELAGVAMIDISLKWLRDTIDGRHIYPSSFVLLLTEDGKPIIQPEESRVSKETVDDIIRLINDLQDYESTNDGEVKIESQASVNRKHMSHSGRITVIHFDTKGRDGTVFFANMKGKPHWQIAVVCYDDEVFASLTNLRLRLMLIMLLAFSILFGLIIRFRHNDEKLRRKTQEQEYINKELQIACDIQQALLPKEEEELGSDYVKVEGRLIPAKAVGGDLYNAFIRDGKLFFCIGDVTGKGVPAALIMAITQTLFRNIAEHGSNPAHIMGELNRAACRNNKSNIFVTLFIGVLDLPTGRLRYCNAGHEVPILLREKGRVNSLLEVKSNLPIGIFEDFNYQLQEMTMEKSDTLLLYTDGLTEAKNAQKELLGREHVIELVAASDCGHTREGQAGTGPAPTADPKTMVEGVIAQWRQFVGNTQQSDDLTLLAISYTPVEEQYLLDEELTLKNDVKEVSTLSAFIKDVTARLNIGKPLAGKLRLALEEAVVNVMEYAYPAGSTGTVNIRVTCTQHPSPNTQHPSPNTQHPSPNTQHPSPNTQHPSPNTQHLVFIITDTGISFDPTEASKADTSLSAEERPVGGLGILLVRELMDSINYERINGKNVLKLKKTINVVQ